MNQRLNKRQQQLLVNGFIHEIKNFNYQNKIKIPNELIELCFLFYSIIPTKLFIIAKNVLSIKMTGIDASLTTFKVTTKSIKSTSAHIQFACFVPDISSKLHIINKNLDGIIGLYKDAATANDLYASLITFDFGKETKKEIPCDLFISKETVPVKFRASGTSRYRGADLPINFFYHETTESIIYTSKDKLYTIPLNKIILTKEQTPKFQIDELSPIKPSLFQNTSVVNEIDTHEIRDMWMEQIYKSNKCFTIVDPNPTPFFHCGTGLQHVKDQKKIKCAVFDLDSKKWIIGRDFLYNHYLLYYTMAFGICKQNYHTPNMAYVVSNRGHTAKYDINKDDWSILHENLDTRHNSNKRPLLWMEENPFVLYCVNSPFFGTFDVRDNNGWMKTNQFGDIYIRSNMINQSIYRKGFNFNSGSYRLQYSMFM